MAKTVFQLCAINQAGKERFNRPVRRARLASTVSNLEPTLIAKTQRFDMNKAFSG